MNEPDVRIFKNPIKIEDASTFLYGWKVVQALRNKNIILIAANKKTRKLTYEIIEDLSWCTNLKIEEIRETTFKTKKCKTCGEIYLREAEKCNCGYVFNSKEGDKVSCPFFVLTRRDVLWNPRLDKEKS